MMFVVELKKKNQLHQRLILHTMQFKTDIYLKFNSIDSRIDTSKLIKIELFLIIQLFELTGICNRINESE